jgi:FkbM family methyltransferase
MSAKKLSHPPAWYALTGDLTMVDVGSRGGFRDLPALRSITQMYSLDIDPSVEPTMDAFASFQHFPFGLYSSSGEVELKVARHPALSSLLEFDEPAFDRHFGLMAGSECWKSAFQVARKTRVSAKVADEFFRDRGLTQVDLLKLDTQGTELAILQGAQEYLGTGRISVIKTEVSFHPFYKQQCLFSDVDRFLTERGYILVDCAFVYGVVDVPSRRKSLQAYKLEDAHHLTSVADAVYVIDPARMNEDSRSAGTTRASLVLNQMGYVSIAAYLLERLGHPPELIDQWLSWGRSRTTMSSRFKTVLRDQLPPWAYRRLRGLKKQLRGGN